MIATLIIGACIGIAGRELVAWAIRRHRENREIARRYWDRQRGWRL
jgi:hypothetical protein